jgi:hypothetical protein
MHGCHTTTEKVLLMMIQTKPETKLQPPTTEKSCFPMNVVRVQFSHDIHLIVFLSSQNLYSSILGDRSAQAQSVDTLPPH